MNAGSIPGSEEFGVLSQSTTKSYKHLSERRTNLFNPAWKKSCPCPLSQFSAAAFTSLSEGNCSFNFGKGKRSLGHRETIQHKRPGMLSDGVILLHGNTITSRKTQELLRKFKWEVWNHPPYSPDSAPNLCSKHLSGTRFSSESDVKTVAENSLNGLGRDFCQAWLTKLVLRSDKCLNIFGDYVEK
ncbi:hypothetical protein AVEN_213896-1 [Araneus ventricosus]|uniref:Histone-lysine N-methyltransferase SETMAR n=1 Tax=Araneus ventricosus TaxID=182803 RepID=A0A4Y2KCS6_ARAVE|nr:hypothetical protein AVEN_213896-1 [Araneus ventricosus]